MSWKAEPHRPIINTHPHLRHLKATQPTGLEPGSGFQKRLCLMDENDQLTTKSVVTTLRWTTFRHFLMEKWGAEIHLFIEPLY